MGIPVLQRAVLEYPFGRRVDDGRDRHADAAIFPKSVSAHAGGWDKSAVGS
jgi:hypothetical protein